MTLRTHHSRMHDAYVSHSCSHIGLLRLLLSGRPSPPCEIGTPMPKNVLADIAFSFFVAAGGRHRVEDACSATMMPWCLARAHAASRFSLSSCHGVMPLLRTHIYTSRQTRRLFGRSPSRCAPWDQNMAWGDHRWGHDWQKRSSHGRGYHDYNNKGEVKAQGRHRHCMSAVLPTVWASTKKQQEHREIQASCKPCRKRWLELTTWVAPRR